MKILYALLVVVGMGLVIFGSWFSGYTYREKKEPEPEAITPSSWITHFNEHQAKLDPLETEFDSLHKVWWGYYNELNFEKMKETNDRMKELANQMRLLNEKYKATRSE